MNKRQLIVAMILFLLFIPSIALSEQNTQERDWEMLYKFPSPSDVNLKATGYDWIEYTKDEKIALMKVLFEMYKLDEGVYSIEKAVKNLDVHYYAAHKEVQDNPKFNEDDLDNFYGVYCALAFGNIISDEESEWGIKSFK